MKISWKMRTTFIRPSNAPIVTAYSAVRLKCTTIPRYTTRKAWNETMAIIWAVMTVILTWKHMTISSPICWTPMALQTRRIYDLYGVDGAAKGARQFKVFTRTFVLYTNAREVYLVLWSHWIWSIWHPLKSHPRFCARSVAKHWGRRIRIQIIWQFIWGISHFRVMCARQRLGNFWSNNAINSLYFSWIFIIIGVFFLFQAQN